MAQVKVYGLDSKLNAIKRRLSDVVHSCVVDALDYPVDKRFHRFFPLHRNDYIIPDDRSDRYTIIEISLFEGRAMATKKALLNLLFERVAAQCGIDPNDLEITLTETPRCNWGIRGAPGDELQLNYRVDV